MLWVLAGVKTTFVDLDERMQVLIATFRKARVGSPGSLVGIVRFLIHSDARNQNGRGWLA